MHLALRQSVLSYILSFFIFAWVQPKWVMQLSQFVQNFSFLDFYVSYPIAYGASIGALFISLAVLGLSFFYLRNEKKEELIRSSSTSNNSQTEESSEDIISVEQSIQQLSTLPHVKLKEIVDEYNIKADKRSKIKILDAIENQEIEVLNQIYSNQMK